MPQIIISLPNSVFPFIAHLLSAAIHEVDDHDLQQPRPPRRSHSRQNQHTNNNNRRQHAQAQNLQRQRQLSTSRHRLRQRRTPQRNQQEQDQEQDILQHNESSALLEPQEQEEFQNDICHPHTNLQNHEYLYKTKAIVFIN